MSFVVLVVGIFFIDNLFYIVILIVIVVLIFIRWFIRYIKIYVDSIIGIVFSVGFVIGLILIRYINFSIDLESLIFGNLWFRSEVDVYLIFVLLGLMLLFIILSYRKFISIIFDYEYVKFSGIKVDLYNYIFVVLIGVFVVIGVCSIGVLLIFSLLIFFVVILNLFVRRFLDFMIIGSVVLILVISIGLIFVYIMK